MDIHILYFSLRKWARNFFILVFVLTLAFFLHGPISHTASDMAMVLVAGGRIHPIYAVDTVEKKVAISFDATWGSTRTPQILEILARHNLKTTFFLTNIWVKQYPQWAKEIVAAGHEIGLHSANHPNMITLSDEKMKKELIDNAALIKEVTNAEPYLFRPPFGAYNNRLIQLVQELNFIPIQWSIDSLDWKNLSKDEIYQRVTKRIHPGAIILFHNDGTNTPQALEPILESLKKDGYSVVPISELLYKDNYYVDINGIQKLRH